MAEFIPFKGFLYNPESVGHFADVMAPPYDVISEKQQTLLYEKHPNNIIRLILGKNKQGDSEQDNVHSRAGDYYRNWIAEGILKQDLQSAFYLTSVTFRVEDKEYTRYGIIGLVRLEPFSRGIVLPHERTFSKVKSERLRLMKACHANFSPVFGLYSDTEQTLSRICEAIQTVQPDISLIDDEGLTHKLWRITDPDTVAYVTRSLEKQKVYIADGHHRYETALNYRDWIRDNEPHIYSRQHPSNYVMMNLISMEDPGLVILPAHRLIKAVPEALLHGFVGKAEAYFNVTRFEMANDPAAAMASFAAFLSGSSDENTIGAYIKGQSCLYCLRLKQGVMQRLFGKDEPEPLLSLDVTVLTRLMMMELLGFDQTRLDDESKIHYQTEIEKAIDDVESGLADVAFILNPTKISQVKRVSEEGHIMPRKSTYFYPKVLSGLVLNSLR